MKARSLLPITFLVTLAVWTLVTWPLARHFREAIPASSLNPHQQPERYMIPGDHLQLLYRFWLLGDILQGNSPWGSNVYEFNRRNDAERRQPGAYYLPFSLVYHAGAKWLGPPAAWNLTGFLALWLTYLFTVLVVRFYTEDSARLYGFALLSILLPYRYHALLGGSPTGFAMLWPPVVIFGLEWASRKGRTAGGAVAGLGLFLACISDVQLFVFALLLGAAWGALLFLADWRRRASFGAAVAAAIRTLWPVAVALAACFAYSQHLAHYLADSAHMASGRSPAEVALYSPSLRHLFSPRILDNMRGVYMGYAWALLAAAAGLFLLRDAIRSRHWRALGILAAWAAGISLLFALAMGPHGPGDGKLYAGIVHLLPPLRMLRQPARFLILAPTLIPVMLVMVSAPLFLRLGRRAGRILLGLFVAAMVFEYARMTRPELCRLDPRQGAYAAVTLEYAHGESAPPRAVAIPLWPGDSHWSSLYQYYASLYRIRMLNGYAPVVEKSYTDDIYTRFRSLNAGVATDEQLDGLLAMDIRCVLLHEDAFPESVSPFPVAQTLARFLQHPRLELLAREGRVWAFRIRTEARTAEPPALAACPVLFPARRFHSARHTLSRVPEETGSTQQVARLNAANPSVTLPRASLIGGGETGWLIDVRGHGQLTLRAADGTRNWRSPPQSVASDGWTWLAVPATELPSYWVGQTVLELVAGEIDVGDVCFTTLRAPLTELACPATCFFHAGQSDPETGSVLLDPERDVMGRVFYGPRLPFAPGRYRVELRYQSEPAAGRTIGHWTIEIPEHNVHRSVTVSSGSESVVLEMELADSRPVTFAFEFAAQQSVRLLEVRVQPAAAGVAPPEAVDEEENL